MRSLCLALLLATTVLCSAAPYRNASALEQRLARAKAECYENYDKIEAHLKFAGVLYDMGCLESAFANVESLLRTPVQGIDAEKLFKLYAQRKLKEFFDKAFMQQLKKLPPASWDIHFQKALQKLAASDPDAAAYNRFAANSERWRSRKKSDIAAITSHIMDSEHQLKHLLRYNIGAATYLYPVDKELSLPFLIRLYFHDPGANYIVNSPVGYVINSILNQRNTLRINRAMIRVKRDPVMLVLEYMHITPRMVEKFLRVNQTSFSREQYLKLCLLATDSVDLQLRTFAFGELMRRDCSVLRPLLGDLLQDEDAGRRAVAVVIMANTVSPGELPEYLAALAKDKAAIVRMTVETVARTRCSEQNYARFKELTGKD